MERRRPRSRRGIRETPGERFAAHRACGTAFPRRRTLEAVRELRAKDVDRALVVSDELPVVCWGRRIELIDRGVLDKEMRVAEIERTVLRQLVLAAKRQPQAIVVRQACGSVGVVNRRLVIREAHLQRPGIASAMDRTDADTPRV